MAANDDRSRRDESLRSGRATGNQPQSPPRWLALTTIGLGVVLALAATGAILIAPEGSVVAVNSRRGGVQFEAGLWVLYLPAVASLAVGVMSRLMPEWLGAPNRRGRVVITVAVISAIASVLLIIDALT